MIKTTMGQLLVAEPALGRMLKRDLPMQDSCDAIDLYKLVTEKIAIFNDKRNELVKEFGQESSDGNWSVEGDEAKRAFFKKVQELLEVTVEIAGTPVSKVRLKAIEGLRVSGVDLIELGPFFEE